MKKMSRRRVKRHFLKKQVPAAGFCLLYLGCPIIVLAAPTGGVVTAGVATIGSSGATTTINQATNKAVINWQSFGIASGETVRFVQPSASSVALNRVVGSDASAIYGTLSANGQVFLINPNGVLFAPGAQVNVAGLVASTLNISDSDFLSGNYRFSKDGKAGSVTNQGDITADGGYVAFLGPQVKNEGLVAARVIGMGAGDKVSLDFNGDSLLKLTVDTVAAGASASNSGTLLADGGTVVMTTGTKDALLSTVVNNSGLIQARTVNNQSGTIILEGGTANIGGTLDASAPNGGNGGFIETSGASVNMAAGLRVTTKAAQGTTGTWLIDPTNYTIGTGVTGTNYWKNTDLQTALNGSNIVVQTDNASGSDAGDINVLAPVSWSANTLTLSAYRNVNINAVLTATGTSSLAMTSGTGGSGSIDYGLTASGFTGKVNFDRSGSGFLTINGSGYSVISNLTELQALQLGNSSVKYYLGADLNANATAFTPIGSGSGNAFKGVFDGGGHTIGNLTINRAGQENTGLFGYTYGATVGNVGLTNVSISGGNKTGGLVGSMANSHLRSSYATGSISGGSETGGLVGSMMGGTIANSYAAVSVTSTGFYVGGLAGYAGSNPSISASYATGSVSGSYTVGGLVGWLESGTVANSYATGSVNGGAQGSIGGLVGSSDGTITSSYATGRLTGSQMAEHYGLVGGSSGAVSNSYWDTQTSGAYDSFAGGTGLTTAQLMSGLPAGFDSNVWGILPGVSYPYLKWSHPGTPQVVSGFVKDAAGSAQAGVAVQALVNGNLMGGTTSGANGFYYMLLGNDSIASNGAVLSYVSGSGSAAKQATATNQSLTGFDITANRVTASSDGALDITGLLSTAKGGNSDDARYTVSGSDVAVGVDLSVAAAGNVTQSGALAVSGTTTVTAGANNITLDKAANNFTGAVSLTGNNVTLTAANALTLGAISAPGSLTLTAGGIINALNSTVSTALFDLKGGTWSQVNGPLPSFSATDFRISGGTFIRALGGDGSGSPYQISDIYGLQGAGSTGMLGKAYTLANDIDASGTSAWSGGTGFVPIGNSTNRFSGTFDGGGHTISGLTIKRSTTEASWDEIGLFGYTGGATISNVGLVNASVTGNYDVGALVGYLGGSSSITNAYAAGSVTGGTNGLHVGGLVGQVESGSSINGAYTAGTVIGGSNVGGLVGLNFGEINNAYATASAESYYGAVGGLVGSNGNKINNAYATGSVTGNTLFTSNIGGLVGARQTGSSIAASYWNTQTSGITDLSKGVGNQANASGVTGRTSDEMKNAANYSTWDTTAVWYLNGGYTAPLLRSFLTPLTVSADSVSKVYDGTATAALNNVAYSGSYNATKVGGTLAWDATRNVGSYGLGGLYTTSQQGYLIAYNPVSLLTITPRAVTGSVTAANKVYDGTTAATISGGITLDNKVVGDAVSATYASGDFADKHVGDNKSVTLAGLGLTGADAGNYTLAADSVTSSASITPATLTTTPLGTVEKVYDGTTLAQVNAGNQPLLQGSFAGDNVSLSFGLASASYDNKNVGDNKAVTLSGLTLGGADAGNYQLASTAITSNVGKITPASLTITASSNSKVYDGTLSAAATPTFSGLVGGDTVSGLAQAYTDKNAGSGKTLTVTGYAVNDGNGGNNYTVSLDNDTTGVITPAQLVYTAVAASREQDKDDPLLTGSISGVVAGESLSAITGGTLAWTAAATKNSPAGRYAITGSGLTVADTNYLATILQASGNAMALTVRAQQGGSGYKDLLPWIVQANHVTGNRLPEGVGAGADTSPDSTVRAVARYAAGDASSGNVGGGAVFGLPLNIVGSGVNVGGHRAVSPMLQISTQEERKPHAL